MPRLADPIGMTTPVVTPAMLDVMTLVPGTTRRFVLCQQMRSGSTDGDNRTTKYGSSSNCSCYNLCACYNPSVSCCRAETPAQKKYATKTLTPLIS